MRISDWSSEVCSSDLKLDCKQAEKALEWMHSKGVRTVVTAFNSSNQLGSFNFMNKAEQLGMTVFAAYSNETGKGNVYPAADARAISVVDTNRGQLGMALDRKSTRLNSSH